MSEPRSILHLFCRSPFTNPALADALPTIRARDAILLYEDAVLGALADIEISPHLAIEFASRHVFVSAADLTARGLGNRPLLPGVQTIDYPQWVKLASEHPVSQSWF